MSNVLVISFLGTGISIDVIKNVNAPANMIKNITISL
jgi:hypothetical protein